jgi:hypothetical protein
VKSADHDVPKQGPAERRRDEDGVPNADLSSMFMEEKHILDERQTDSLARTCVESLKDSHGVVDFVCRRQSTTEGKEEAHQSTPEQDGRTSP